MKVDRALIIRRLQVPLSLEYAAMCAESCEKHSVPYEYIDGIEFMSSQDAMEAVGVWLHPDNVKKKVSQGNNNCHASHIKCWRRILELDRACLILEHDVVVKGDVCTIDIIEDAINIFGHRINDHIRYEPVGPIEKMVRIPQSIGGHAYALTPNTARWFVEDAEKNGVNINVDEWINYRCGKPLYLTEPPQLVCWPRYSTREWIDPEKKRMTPGSTTTFGSSNTPGYLAGYKLYEN
jgi:GR25 family glycosyltransferase involved in LPS biosynthesis